MSSTVIYADARLVVVDKAAGVSLATRSTDTGAAVARLLADLDDVERDKHGLSADLLLVHRLDVSTSGLVVLARDHEAHRELATAFADRRVRKTYLALVWGHPHPAHGVWDLPLGPDRSDRRRMRADPAGRPAVSEYATLARARHVALLRLEPRTGRTHQLRVHCAAAGHPIVGDDLYGGPRYRGVRDPVLRHALAPGRSLLHAWRLHLPATHETAELIVHAPPPSDLVASCAALAIALPEPD